MYSLGVSVRGKKVLLESLDASKPYDTPSVLHLTEENGFTLFRINKQCSDAKIQ